MDFNVTCDPGACVSLQTLWDAGIFTRNSVMPSSCCKCFVPSLLLAKRLSERLVSYCVCSTSEGWNC